MALFRSVFSIKAILDSQRAQGHANILSIGTATPSNYFYQADYPDFYFRVTNSEHMIDLKNKFRRICDKTSIKKRHMLLTEELLRDNPNMCEYMAPSLNARQDLVITEVPKLGKAAATKAIKEWGLPKSEITHLIFCTTSGIDMPGADYQLVKLLGLSPKVKRFMMYQQGCSGGGMVLRLAKDLAENNKGSRVLVVCSETNNLLFRGPNENHIDSLIAQALFGDGAAATIIGSDPNLSIEKPLFKIVSTTQTILPNSERAITMNLREEGLTFHLHKDLPKMVSDNIEEVLVHAFSQLGRVINDWNSLFWIAHPGGPAILDHVELQLNLNKDKLRASRHVLSEYGNLTSACVLFVIDEMRKTSMKEGKRTTGEGLDWGILFGISPGLTMDMVVLHSLPVTTPASIKNVNGAK